MNTPTQSDPVMEMARKIADELYPEKLHDALSVVTHSVARKVALAAIRATTEAAASWVEQYPSPLNDLPMALAIRALAQGVRANHHLSAEG